VVVAQTVSKRHKKPLLARGCMREVAVALLQKPPARLALASEGRGSSADGCVRGA